MENLYREAIGKVNQSKSPTDKIAIDEKGINQAKKVFKAQDLNDVIDISRREAITDSGRISRKDLKTRVYVSEQVNHGHKHVKAKTEAEAKTFSMTGKKNAQFLPNIDVVTLEKTAMQDALSKGDIIKKEGGTYYFFHRSESIVGYDMGNPTRWVRVELTSSNIRHSQPIGLNRLKVYIPKAKE